MYFNNKYKYRTLHGKCYQIKKKKEKEKEKQKTKNKHYLKDCVKQIINFSYKNIICNEIILSDVAG